MNLNVAPKLRWPADKVEAILIREAERARKGFAAYRRMMRPTMKWGWFTQELSDTLQQFYQDMVDGKRPKLAIMAPPQSGKSLAAEDFVSWLAGNAPDMKTIYASHSEHLGLRCNVGMQRMIESERYQQVFETTIGAKGWARNNSLVEYVNKAGSFRNVTVNGGINGLELHLGILDDPVKDRADANSVVIREKIWNWYTDVFRPRFAANSGMLWVMTRWHLDDPLGRALEKEPEIKVLKFKAIAEHDEKYRKRGEALFPEFKPLAMLRAQQRLMSDASWEAEYQQEPYLVGGGMFPIEKLHIVPVFDRSQIEASVLAVDKACLVAGTIITTARGCMPIEKVRVGDLVLTRSGFKRVTRSWLSKMTSELTTVLMSDGSEVTGTFDHEIYDKRRGWTCLGNVDCDSVFIHVSEVAACCRNEFSEAVATSETVKLNTFISGDISGVGGDRFIETSGPRVEGLFPLAIISTTTIGIGITTKSKTFVALRQRSIARFMRPIFHFRLRWQIQNIERRHKNIFVSSWGNYGRINVRTVDAISGLRVSRKFGGVWAAVVRTFKNIIKADRLIGWINDLVENVGGCFSLLETRSTVSLVERNCFAGSASGVTVGSLLKSRLPHRTHALKVAHHLQGIPVYDLSVEDAPEFFANGVLVHNSTKDGDGACTAIVLMHKLKNGQFLIETVLRGRWGALEREQVIKGAAEAARQSLGQMKWNLKVVIEMEPGSGGKESAEATIRNLAGFVVVADKVTGEKTVRAEPFAAQVQGSNVLLVAGRWVEGFLEELEGWPFSKTLDQGDAASMAFSHLTSGPLYDSSYSGFS